MQSKAIKLTRLTRVAQVLSEVLEGAKHCMVWDAIEGDRTHIDGIYVPRSAPNTKQCMHCDPIKVHRWCLRASVSSLYQVVHACHPIGVHRWRRSAPYIKECKRCYPIGVHRWRLSASVSSLHQAVHAL